MKLNKVYGTDYSNMIFDKLSSMPWSNSERFKAKTLNLLYLNHSGAKSTAPLINNLIGGDETLTDEDKTTIAESIDLMFAENWKYLWDALFAKYNPIYNYGMEENETIGVTGESNGSKSETRTVNDKLVVDRDQTINSEMSQTTEATDSSTTNGETTKQVYGFDSENGVNDSKETTSGNTNGTNNSINSGTNKDITEEDTTETRTNTDSLTGTDSETNKQNTTRTLTRDGNIGVTTSQQMIESELKLRETKYLDLIFKDIDSLLTLSIYD